MKLSRSPKHTLAEIVKLLDEEQDRIKQEMANTLIDVRRTCRPEFADRVEKYLLKHDLLPLGRKAN
jgi:hypothetical protein